MHVAEKGLMSQSISPRRDKYAIDCAYKRLQQNKKDTYMGIPPSNNLIPPLYFMLQLAAAAPGLFMPLFMLLLKIILLKILVIITVIIIVHVAT